MWLMVWESDFAFDNSIMEDQMPVESNQVSTLLQDSII